MKKEMREKNKQKKPKKKDTSNAKSVKWKKWSECEEISSKPQCQITALFSAKGNQQKNKRILLCSQIIFIRDQKAKTPKRIFSLVIF